LDTPSYTKVVHNFLAFYATRMFITVFTRVYSVVLARIGLFYFIKVKKKKKMYNVHWQHKGHYTYMVR